MSKSESNSFVTIVIVIVVGLLIYLYMSKSCGSGSGHDLSAMNAHRIQIGNVEVGFDMTPKDMKKNNKGAAIEKRTAPGINNGTTEIKSYDYYTINNEVAVTFQDNHINEICIWNPQYVTVNNIHVGSPLGDVVNSCPEIQFWYTEYWFDYVYCQYVRAIYLYDEATCTGYMFYESQMSESLRAAVYRAAGVANGSGSFTVSSLSTVDYKAFCQTLTVAQIVYRNCGCNNTAPADAPQKKVDNDSDNEGSGISELLQVHENLSYEPLARKWLEAFVLRDVKTLKRLSSKTLYDAIVYYYKNSNPVRDKNKGVKTARESQSKITTPDANKTIVHFLEETDFGPHGIHVYIHEEKGRRVVYQMCITGGRGRVFFILDMDNKNNL